MALSKSKKKLKIGKSIDNFKKHEFKRNAQKELCYIMVKPEIACSQNKVWDIISMLKQKGLKIEYQSTEFLDKEIVKEHYKHLNDKPFFNGLVDYMTSDLIVKLIVSGKDAVKVVRELCGPTNPADATDGTIRKKYGTDIQMNAIHASATVEEAKSETRLHLNKNLVNKLRKKGFEL
jgi:nucleoside-diphosphate kinase